MDINQQVEEATRRGEEARQLLEHPAFKHAMARLEAEYTASWRNTSPDQTEEREQAYRMLQALDRLQLDIKSTSDSAEITLYNHRTAFRNAR